MGADPAGRRSGAERQQLTGATKSPSTPACPETTTRVTTASGQDGGATGYTGEGHQHAEDEELKTDGQNFKGLRAQRRPVPISGGR